MPDYRSIPSIEQLRQRPAVQRLEQRFGAAATIDALRDAAAGMRAAIAAGSGERETGDQVAVRMERTAALQLADAFRPSLRPVINATGVILHTNLGRAPLSPAAIERVAMLTRGYSNLEYDLDRGGRGRRDIHAEALLRQLTGAEASVVVNNNAAAVLLVLAALADRREVIVSRGELVEIGGGFRLPDVMAQSGAILREVGTTNRTRVSDYGAAINDRTALILRVHPSNFSIEGFTERPDVGELAALAHRFAIPMVEDLGSGHLRDSPGHPLAGAEPSVTGTVAAGVDVCCFSGDKLLGGPQAGIIVGRAVLVEGIRRHPLMRALRVDKMIYAALEATLAEYAWGHEALTVPAQQMLRATSDDLESRAHALAAGVNQLNGWSTAVMKNHSTIGGGSAPGSALPTTVVALHKDGLSTEALERRLRELDPPIIARIEGDQLLVDLRTVLPVDAALLPDLLGLV